MGRTERNEAIREESRGRILDAALTLFARNGFEGTSIRALAQEAGISLGLLYNYFPGKEDVLRAILEQGMADVLRSFSDALNPDVPGSPIERLFRSTLAILDRNRRFWMLFYSIRSQPAVIERLAPEIGELSARIQAGLEGILSATGATDVATEARLLFAIIDGISQQYVLDPTNYPAEAVIDRALLLLGATPEGGTA
jgi:AcrR family transcriptional regulator